MMNIFWHTDLTDSTDSVSNDVTFDMYLSYLDLLTKPFMVANQAICDALSASVKSVLSVWECL